MLETLLTVGIGLVFLIAGLAGLSRTPSNKTGRFTQFLRQLRFRKMDRTKHSANDRLFR